MSDPNAPGGLPASTALAEASPDSIVELLSRDPEGLQAQDRRRIIEALREQRVRWEAAQAAGAKPKATKAVSLVGRKIGASAEDLGL